MIFHTCILFSCSVFTCNGSRLDPNYFANLSSNDLMRKHVLFEFPLFCFGSLPCDVILLLLEH